MKLREMVATMLLVTAAPTLAGEVPLDFAPEQKAAAQPAPKKKGAKASLPAEAFVSASTPAPAPNKSTTASAANSGGALAPSGKPADNALPLDGGAAGKATGGNVKPANNELSLMDIPSFDDLDARLLKDVGLCIFPFVKEDKVDSKGTGPNLERIQKIFFDVARSSPILKDAIVLGKEAPICGIEDTACLSNLGGFTGCTVVLAGRATREDNGYSLRARIIDSKHTKLMARVNQLLVTDDEREMAAWAEGQACRALKVNCAGDVKLDADRADMRILIDNKPIERKPSLAPGLPEVLTLMPGVYKVRASIGQRNSREATLAVRRNQSETIYVRQTEDGGVPLMLKSELKPNEVPGPSKEFVHTGTKPTKIVGIVAAGLGVVALGVAGQQALHSKSLADDASANFTANGGYYQPGQVGTATGVSSAKKNATILTAVGAGLIVLGGVLFFAF